MGASFCAALGVTAAVLLTFGAGKRGTDVGLQLTARLSFLFFWPAYTASALTTLFGPRFRPLKQRSREFGLAFASSQTVHVGLVAWLCWIGLAPTRGVFILFGIAAFWMYLLALASFGRVQRMLGRKGWWLVRAVGLNYILYAFAIDFFSKPLLGDAKQIIGYLPFAVLVVAGPLLRLAAFVRNMKTGRSEADAKGAAPLPALTREFGNECPPDSDLARKAQ
jgi:DMSO/TMAO reductase YedYZ heme-binding membrane subunit